MTSFPSARFLLCLPLSLVLLAAGCSQADQQSSSRPDNRIIQRGDDVLAAGSKPEISDSVIGDAILAGGEVRFSGTTGGDYLGAGGTQDIRGQIHGSLRAAGGDVRVAATVDRNATIAGGAVRLSSATRIARNAYLAGGEVYVDGVVGQGLFVSGGKVVLTGSVNGDVEISAGELEIGPGVKIAGNLKYRVPAAEVDIDPSAHIAGVVTALPMQSWGGLIRFGVMLIILWFISFLVTGCILVAFAPGFAEHTAGVLRERLGYSLLTGLAWLVGIPVVIVIACITIVGLPLGLMTAVLYAIALYLSRIVAAFWIGRLILRKNIAQSRGRAVAAFLVGGILLCFVGWIPVLGWLIQLFTTIMGLGALMLSLWTYLRRPQNSYPLPQQ